MKEARHIVIKSLFNASEYTEFKSACSNADVSQSKKLRDLGLGWARRNDRRRTPHVEWPEFGHNRPMSLPGRARFTSRTKSFRS